MFAVEFYGNGPNLRTVLKGEWWVRAIPYLGMTSLLTEFVLDFRYLAPFRNASG